MWEDKFSSEDCKSGDTMNVRFYIDPETGCPHIHRHGVEEYEVEDVLADYTEDWQSRRGSRTAIGQTRGGRYLMVVYSRASETGRITVITAYELGGSALAAYWRRQRRRGRR